METRNFKDLKNLIKSNPEKLNMMMRYPSNFTNTIKITNRIGTNIIHLIALYNPSYLYSVFISNLFQPDFEANNLFFRKNIFGLTWLHILCMYNIEYFVEVKEFVTNALSKEQDIVGNTFLHKIARFNPSYLKIVLNHIYTRLDYNAILSKRDILGDTFLHTLCIYHPNKYNEYINSFSNEIVQIKNKFNMKCFDYLIIQKN